MLLFLFQVHVALAWGNINLFDFNSHLQCDKVSLHLWPMPQGVDDLLYSIGTPGKKFFCSADNFWDIFLTGAFFRKNFKEKCWSIPNTHFCFKRFDRICFCSKVISSTAQKYDDFRDTFSCISGRCRRAWTISSTPSALPVRSLSKNLKNSNKREKFNSEFAGPIFFSAYICYGPTSQSY